MPKWYHSDSEMSSSSQPDAVVAPVDILLRELERRSQTIRYWELQCAKLVATGGACPEWDVTVATMASAHCFGHACDFSKLVEDVTPKDEVCD